MRSLTFLTGDVIAVVAASVLATWLWAIGVRGQEPELYTQLAPFVATLPVVFFFLGLYPGNGLGPVETLRRLTLGTTGVFIVLGLASFLLKVGTLYSRGTFLLAWLLALILVPVLRGFASSLVSHHTRWNEPAVLIGSGDLMEQAEASLNSSRFLGYSPALKIDQVPHASWARSLAAQGFTTAILALRDSQEIGEAFRVLEGHFSRIVTIRSDQGLPVDGVRALNLGGILGTEFRDDLLVRRNQVVKRSFDIVAGSILLFCAVPAIGLAALAVRVVAGKPVFFKQGREGAGGRTFQVHKIRTMLKDADSKLNKVLEESPELAGQWSENYKLADDPRVIPVLGKFLRRWSIDELPQLWNVVKGDMSLVGPRPFPEYHLNEFREEFRVLRRRVRPGLTGLWQVMIRSDGSLELQQSFDTYYIRNWSIWLDIYILSRTASAVITGRGAS